MSEQFSGVVTVVDGQGREVFRFDSRFAVLDIGGLGNEGDLRLRGDDGETRIAIDGGRQLVTVTNLEGVTVFRFDAAHSLLDLGPSLGGNGAEADLRLFGSDGQPTIHLDGASGDIRLLGGDCAEEFDVDGRLPAGPGDVMSIGPAGLLEPCAAGYDRRVAGVLSGAGGLRPGVVLGARHGADRRPALALTGRAYCKVDAGYGAIDVGDLLTSSQTRGHAMKATDPARAFGATVGKALGALSAGTGLVPILVTLH
ncbi:hypothetical protein SAMN05421812_107144 [Asanoa hainanensis]|uniref:Uncharacterized protein n=1 Tax=Asanoa hainanensis TaxID=560556 RepID=A0A239N2X8_9ACTN|nr:hypothetical protein [Asanoa hainanensis]SNT48823.1 hypothetical protein SAMN05421812_107144 [Asanoa hainanensis]